MNEEKKIEKNMERIDENLKQLSKRICKAIKGSNLKFSYKVISGPEVIYLELYSNFNFFYALQFDVSAFSHSEFKTEIVLILDKANNKLSYVIKELDDNNKCVQAEAFSTPVYVDDDSLIDLMIKGINEYF